MSRWRRQVGVPARVAVAQGAVTPTGSWPGGRLRHGGLPRQRDNRVRAGGGGGLGCDRGHLQSLMPDVSVDILTQTTPPAPAKLPLGRAATPRQRFANRLAAAWQEASFNADSSRCTPMHADKDRAGELFGGHLQPRLDRTQGGVVGQRGPPQPPRQAPATVRTMRPAPTAGGHDARVRRGPAACVSTSRRPPAMPKTGRRWACPPGSVLGRLVLLSRKLREWLEHSIWSDAAGFCTDGDFDLPGRARWIFTMRAGTDDRFRAYAADLASVLGHADRVRPFEDYCVGLISAEGRKSVEPLAAVTAPERTAAQHQSLLHLVAQAPWSDAAMLTPGARAWCCRRSPARSRSRPGSSTTRVTPRRATIRSAWPGNIAARWASRRTARWR